VLVLAFAFVYDVALGHDRFYDANLQREAGFAADSRDIERGLTRDLDARVSKKAWSSGLAIAGHARVLARATLDPGSVVVSDFTIQPSQLALRLVVSGAFRLPADTSVGFAGLNYFSESFKVSGLPLNHSCGDSCDASYDLPVAAEQSSSGPGLPPIQRLFPTDAGPAGRGPHLSIDEFTYRLLFRHYKAQTGDPTYASGAFLRMLYFSATTQTTLGLGDITPVSTLARVLVMVQALLGIITIGVFLNNLRGR
jgi:hypothetical protein